MCPPCLHGRVPSQLAAVLLDVLREHNVENQPCLNGPFETRCGLSPKHPATSGTVVYQWDDPTANLQGHAVQTILWGMCLDDRCEKLTTVALHGNSTGPGTYSHQLTWNNELASITAAASAVEEPGDLTSLASQRNTTVFHYGPVQRHGNRKWYAYGIRGVRYAVV